MKKVPSQTTPGHNMQLRSWLAELMMLRTYGPLPQYFWRSKKYKWPYTREVKAISKFLKTYGEAAVVSVACNRSLTTYTDYAKLEYFIQQEKSSLEKICKPKDITPVIREDRCKKDLREPRSFVSKKTLFERLEELENE